MRVCGAQELEPAVVGHPQQCEELWKMQLLLLEQVSSATCRSQIQYLPTITSLPAYHKSATCLRRNPLPAYHISATCLRDARY